jgi:hypothetical protein
MTPDFSPNPHFSSPNTESSLSLVLQYLETQKVIKAVDYANAVAPSLQSKNASPAAELSPSFKPSSESIFQNLLDEALPA